MAPTVPDEAALVHVVVVVVQLPQGDLKPASLTVGVWISIILRYLDTILPVHPIEVITEADSEARRTRAPWEG